MCSSAFRAQVSAYVYTHLHWDMNALHASCSVWIKLVLQAAVVLETLIAKEALLLCQKTIKLFHHDIGIWMPYYHQRKLWHRTTAQATTTVVVIDLHCRKPLTNLYRVSSSLDRMKPSIGHRILVTLKWPGSLGQTCKQMNCVSEVNSGCEEFTKLHGGIPSKFYFKQEPLP